MNYQLKNDKLCVTVSDKGAELVSVIGNDGFEYIWQGADGFWSNHAPVLFPACGRILNNTYTTGGVSYNMGLHGFAANEIFSAELATDNELILTLTENEETLKQYPFEFKFTARFTLSDDALSVDFTVDNKGNKVLPYMVGWHPGFNLENGCAIGDFSLKFNSGDELIWHPLQNGCFVCPVGQSYTVNNATYALCEEEIYKNDTLIFKGTGERALLFSDKVNHGVDMSWSDNLPYFCIWKEDSSDARFVCLEPWSDVPGDGDAPENFDTKKLSRLQPAERKAYSYKVKFTK